MTVLLREEQEAFELTPDEESDLLASIAYDSCGYMRAGLTTVIQRAFHDYGLHRLEANIQPENSRSIALVRDLGFEREGYSPRCTSRRS